MSAVPDDTLGLHVDVTVTAAPIEGHARPFATMDHGTAAMSERETGE